MKSMTEEEDEVHKYVPRHETLAKRIRKLKNEPISTPTKCSKDLKGNQIKLFLRLAAKVL